MNLEKLVRKNIRMLKPYTSARQTAKSGILLDANENPVGQYNRYPDPYAREIKKRYAQIAGVGEENIFIGNGSDEVIDLLLRIFCEPGVDNIVILDPTYGMYKITADIQGVENRSALLTSDFQIDIESTMQAVTSSTKIIFACSPNNPTGNLLRSEDILELCARFKGIVTVDEAYIEFADRESMALKADNLVVVRTLSKVWGAAGLRVGFAIAPKEIISTLNRVKPPYNINQLSQDAAREILDEKLNITGIIKERARVKKRLEQFGLTVFPSDANFILFQIPQASKIQRQLQKNGIAVRDRSNMPLLENCLRMSIGTSAQNDAFLTELERLLEKIAFIDRDGVLLYEPQDDFQIDSLMKYKILPGVIEGLRILQNSGYRLVLVSNQDGLGTDRFPKNDFKKVQNKMIDDLGNKGIEFDEIFICPHLEGDNCDCRKPKIGLIKYYLMSTPINFERSIMIGDRETDMQFAKNIGVRGIRAKTNAAFPNIF